MELFFLYLWLKLDVVGGALQFANWILGVAACVSTLYYAVEKDYSQKPGWQAQIWKWVKTIWCTTILVSIFQLALPTKTDVAVLVGASMAIKFANSPEGEKVSALLRGKANEILDEELKKLNPVK